MKIRVISLPSSHRRRENIDAQFQHLGLDYEYFDAITGHDALRHVHHYDDREFTLNCGRSATENEIACYASHLALWRQCVASNKPLLILEDDAHLCETFTEGFGVVAELINQLGFIRASTPETRSTFRIERSGKFEIRYCRRVPLLAVAYALSPAAAAKLASRGSVVQEPVDKFVQRFWRHKQAIHALQPHIVRPDDIAEESDIGNRVRPSYGPAIWTRRFLRKAANSVRRDVYVIRSVMRLSLPWPLRRSLPRKNEAVFR